MSNAQRDIDDMDEKIDELVGLIHTVSGVLDSDLVQIMQDIVEEWRIYTIVSIKEMIETIEGYEK